MKAKDAIKVTEDLEESLKKLMKTTINVGILEDAGTYPNGTSVATVGAVHEYGLGVPQRSFLKVPFEEAEKDIEENSAKISKELIEGDIDLDEAVETMGEYLVTVSKNSWTDNNWAPTKSSNPPLYDTGQLFDSINYEVNDD